MNGPPLTHRVFVPGRIELLGKHTDYAGGSSLLVAVDRGFTFDATAVPGDRLTVVARDSGEEVSYTLPDGRVAGPTSATPGSGPDGPRPSWARYADSLLDCLRESGYGHALGGARLSFSSTLPADAGLSSSSALITGLFLALDAVWGLSGRGDFRESVPDREALADWLARAERGEAVGTRGGSQDHTAILCARPGCVVRYGHAPVRFRGQAPVPPGWRFAVAVSGVVADKGAAARSAYNRLSDLAAEAARAWAEGRGAHAHSGLEGGSPRRRRSPTLADALEAEGSQWPVLETIRRGAAVLDVDPAPLTDRARHFCEEVGLVDEAFEALSRGDVEELGHSVDRSVALGAELLANQVPETLALARLARDVGAAAASPFGAGFGGSVWALIPDDAGQRFLDLWRRRYLEAFPARTDALFFSSTAAAAARRVEQRS